MRVGGSLSALYFFCNFLRNLYKSVDNIPKKVYNKIMERRNGTMGKKKKQKKKPINWQELAISAVIDLIIGTILIIIGKYIG